MIDATASDRLLSDLWYEYIESNQDVPVQAWHDEWDRLNKERAKARMLEIKDFLLECEPSEWLDTLVETCPTYLIDAMYDALPEE